MSSHCQLYVYKYESDGLSYFFLIYILFSEIFSIFCFCAGQPKIRKSLTDVEVTEKENLLLEVEVYAVPEPKIVWFRDGQEVRSDARIKIQRDNQRLETYNLTVNMIKRDEAGVYEMKASNTLGTAVTKSIVTVNSEYKIHFYFLRFVWKFHSRTVTLFFVHTICC